MIPKQKTPNNLKAILERRNVKNYEMAKVVCLGPSNIYAYTVGKSEPTIANLGKICRYLRCKPDDIYPALNMEGELSETNNA